jgi:hypothetical protein
MKHYYTARKYYGVWHGVVYHYSNLDEDEVVDFKSGGVGTSSEAYDAAGEWADENGIEAEID